MYGVWRVREFHPDDPALVAGAAILLRGGLVAFPTETVYGLGAHARDVTAVLRIFHAKGRPKSDPLIVHICHTGQLTEVASEVSPLAWRLAEVFWPGPLTLILPRHPSIPPEVSSGGDTVAVRIPSHPLARALLRAAAVPVAAPSANRFSRPSPTLAEHVVADLGLDVELILDGGPTEVGIESTIVRVDGDKIVILRPGGVSREQLLEVVDQVEFNEGHYVHDNQVAEGPGLLTRHYAPQTALHLADGPREPCLVWLHLQAMMAMARGERFGLLLWEEDQVALAGVEAPRVVLSWGGDMAETARHLYVALRQVDELGVEKVYGYLPPPEGLGLGIRDRMIRAAEGRINSVAELASHRPEEEMRSAPDLEQSQGEVEGESGEATPDQWEAEVPATEADFGGSTSS